MEEIKRTEDIRLFIMVHNHCRAKGMNYGHMVTFFARFDIDESTYEDLCMQYDDLESQGVV